MARASTTHTLRGATKIFGLGAVGAVAAVLAGVVIPRVLGKHLYGEYSFLAAVYGYAAVASALGMPLVVTRHFSPLFTEGRLTEAKGLFAAVLRLRLMTGAVFALATYAFLTLANPFDVGVGATLAVALLVYLMSLSNALFLLQWGAQNHGYWGLLQPCRAVGRLLLAPLLFPWFGLTGFLGGLVLVEALVALWGRRLSRLVVPDGGEVRPDFAALRAHAGLALRAWSTSILRALSQYLGPVLIAFSTGQAAVTGFFSLAITLNHLLARLPEQGASAFVPMFGIFHRQGDLTRLSRWAGMAIRGGMLGYFAVWGVAVLIGRPLIVHVLGPGFEPVYPLLSVILASLPFRWATLVLQMVFSQHRRPQLGIPVAVVGMLTFVVLGVWWLAVWGPLGLAGAYSVAAALACLAAYVVGFRRLELSLEAGRTALLLLCAVPYGLAAWWAESIGERLTALVPATAAALLVAHLSGAFKLDEARAVWRALAGRKHPTEA
ncbi:MAG: oligosaccharide flippase family protein [bacterium]|nr:oligosaccharide flippase family protein [bacterium]